MPSMPFRMARWLSSISPLRLMATISLSDLEVGDLGRAEIEHGPARRIRDRPSQRLRQARPRQSDLQHGILEMQRGQPRRAQRPVLLLRMLQDQQRYPAVDRRDAVANAQRQWLVAVRTVRYRVRDAPASGSVWFDIRPLYAAPAPASTTEPAPARSRLASRGRHAPRWGRGGAPRRRYWLGERRAQRLYWRGVICRAAGIRARKRALVR